MGEIENDSIEVSFSHTIASSSARSSKLSSINTIQNRDICAIVLVGCCFEV